MTRRVRAAALVLAVAMLIAPVLRAQAAPETFTATASIRHGAAIASAPLVVTVTRYSSDAERASVTKAVAAGSAALRAALLRLPDAGVLQLGERRTPLKFAGQRATGSGRLVTIVTAEPVFYVGGSLPAPKPRAGFEVAIAFLVLKDGEAGMGELAPAAKVRVTEDGALAVEDYGAPMVWLADLVHKP